MIPALLIAHVSFAALWFAAPLALVSMLRASVPHGREGFLAIAQTCTRFGIFGAVGNVGTLATGVGLLFAVYGGFAAPVRFHIALGLVLIGALLGFAVQKPAGGTLVTQASQPTWTPADSEATIRRLAMGVGIQHLLWTCALTAMFLG